MRGKATGRIRLRKIEEASAENLIPFIKASICEGALVVTDGWQGYTGLQNNGYQHEIKNIKQSGKKPHELLPHVHRVDSLLKDGWMVCCKGASNNGTLIIILMNSRFDLIDAHHGRGGYFLSIDATSCYDVFNAISWSHWREGRPIELMGRSGYPFLKKLNRWSQSETNSHVRNSE